MADDELLDLVEIWNELRPPVPPQPPPVEAAQPVSTPKLLHYEATRDFGVNQNHDPFIPQGTRLMFDGQTAVIPGLAPREMPELGSAIRAGWLVPATSRVVADRTRRNRFDDLPVIEQLMPPERERPVVLGGGRGRIPGMVPIPRRIVRMQATLSPTGQTAIWDALDDEDPQGEYLNLPEGLSIIPGTAHVVDRREEFHERWSD